MLLLIYPTAILPLCLYVRQPYCSTVSLLTTSLPYSPTVPAVTGLCLTATLFLLPPHCLIASMCHCRTVQLPYCPTNALSHCRTVPLPHCPTASLSPCFTVSLPHCPLALISRHCLPIPLSHCPTASKSHCLAVPLPHYPTA
jgi:hypothetical protein